MGSIEKYVGSPLLAAVYAEGYWAGLAKIRPRVCFLKPERAKRLIRSALKKHPRNVVYAAFREGKEMWTKHD
jgi:hypothetical protein